ncbi:galactofuranosylgalactofuranosylrhamnosyl-N-acetylglucosaminyl-diphospho-decaprenol beta-1,5/1,6-galactofuranosyltransferase [Tamaricihabitans halophyticus]|uniref:Galactofuranosylgalactofuranosylrhamnosyl-N-acetylglucosaminyl-diphospho-decaprenol beta-1,5/1,6-galactofuranosyltransferase n=1 Tax=Tamaricihabitans halophyticus TaxID=1262583 RepID=A0A4R2R2N9_9PSEU|nr:glycosyltransferase [Tamaricihabitans halophyticus]TCP57012.1 galactofuranosylgalactofuranosylrhamnosyl-N-acetylglucosaminyl-diphospho-decaprenol beta-1,5/1,6-galactofuranosyltransferase [Tamaricihabitans halophyticus]
MSGKATTGASATAGTGSVGGNGVAKPETTTSLVERIASDRLLAQRGLFAGPSDVVSSDLYAEVTQGIAHRERGSVELEPSTAVSMNTYFGRFPASYWQRWTRVSEVTVQLLVSGSGRVSIGASDMQGGNRTVAAERVHAAELGSVTLTAKIDRFLDGGALWLDLETQVDERLSVQAVRWTVDAPEQVRPTAVTICTCNRADDCMATLRTLASEMAALETLDTVYVVDQGNDTVDSRDGFNEAAAALGAKLRYLKQPNLGGAGGFTRGLYEVAGQSHTEHANVLFMDDDVLLEPDLVIRLTAFSNKVTEPAIIGGQMLNLLHPNQLHVGAEYADLNALQPGKPVEHSLETADLLGVDEETGLPNRQERRLDAGYNGWWSCLIPYEVVKAVGYPMPFFFQWDDSEYSYRARAYGFPTITLPGAGVWHMDFWWKDWDEWHRYFNLRNSMITAALHSPLNVTVLIRTLLAQLVRYLLGMQYGLAATLLKAVEDFLAGPEFLHDGGAAAMQDIRRIRAEYPETKRHPATDMPGIRSSDVAIINTAPRPSMQRAVLLKRVLYRLLGKHVHDLGAIPADEAHWWHVSLFNTAVVTDANQEGVRIRRYDKQEMFRLAKRAAELMNRVRKEAPAVQQRYRQALPQLTSRENWTRLYEL